MTHHGDSDRMSEGRSIFKRVKILSSPGSKAILSPMLRRNSSVGKSVFLHRAARVTCPIHHASPESITCCTSKHVTLVRYGTPNICTMRATVIAANPPKEV